MTRVRPSTYSDRITNPTAATATPTRRTARTATADREWRLQKRMAQLHNSITTAVLIFIGSDRSRGAASQRTSKVQPAITTDVTATTVNRQAWPTTSA